MSCASRAAAGLSASSFSTGPWWSCPLSPPGAGPYVLGPECGVLSPEVLARCHHLVRIPTAFSLNLATAGVLYDRLRCLGRFATRPIDEGGRLSRRTENVQGCQRRRV
jgi:hypothetical protein